MAQLTFVEKYFRDKGHSEGLNEGIEQGRREANFETARRLRAMGMIAIEIQKATKLSFGEISSL